MEEKKRWLPMKIDWKLKNGEEIVIDEKNKLVKIDDNVIYYNDEYGTHVIDRNNKIYERRSRSDIFKVDFKTSVLSVEFDNFKQKYDIKTKYEEKNNIIRLTYSLGDEKKVIEITRKEDL